MAIIEASSRIGIADIPATRFPRTAQYLSDGGVFKKRGTDTIPAMLSPGEFVVNPKSSKKYGGLLEQINQGDVIGTVGSTGRSTGPHLDFRINWFQTRLDPMTVIK